MSVEGEAMKEGMAVSKSLLCGAFLLACLAAAPAAPVNWPAWGGPGGSQTTPDTDWNPLALQGGARILWRFDLSVGYSGVVVRDGRLFAAGRTRGYPNELAFCCLDATTGGVVWKTVVDINGIPSSTPTVDGDFFYALNGDGTLVCLRASTGEIVWQEDMKSDYDAVAPAYSWSSSPVVDGDTLLLGANNRGLGIDKTTGALRWTVGSPQRPLPNQPDNDSLASCVLSISGGKHTALFSLYGLVCAVDIPTGTVLWKYAYDPLKSGGALHDPALLGDVLYLPDQGLLLGGVDTAQPLVRWQKAPGWMSFPAPVPVNGYLYGTSAPDAFSLASWQAVLNEDFSLFCIDPGTGATVWSKHGKYQSAIAAGGTLISLELTGALRVRKATPEGVQDLSSADVYGGTKTPRLFPSPPVLYDGKLYLRNYYGDLLCVSMR
jgi:outer membrane protein assembly factor BamB